jgi:hypothetical protein
VDVVGEIAAGATTATDTWGSVRPPMKWAGIKNAQSIGKTAVAGSFAP